MKTFFEELGIQYEEHEDGLLYPILKLPQEEEPRYSKYGQLRLQFLREHKVELLNDLIVHGKLNAHLNQVEDSCKERYDVLFERMKLYFDTSEELKAKDCMRWFHTFYNIHAHVDEFVIRELVYE